ncbi:MAG: 4'-phosphopantetheinyl transferase superfamily protein [Tidjanibacter sp.]|nr:4'-phosphopantetheinyl transferase superfamily protein [Tidjanibacter sp.]
MNILKHIEIPRGRILIARVEPEAENSPLLTDEDREHLATLTAPARRAQWSTCREILRAELGQKAGLRYAASGALILTHPIGEVSYVSISHSNEWVAVMLSERRCGVDIEALDRNFSRVASRYISHEERNKFEHRVGGDFEAIMWSAEEALYKYGSNPGLDFLQDMVITEFDPERRVLSAELYGLPTPPIHYTLFEGQVVCYLSEK